MSRHINFLYSTVLPPCPTKATYWVVLSRFTTTLSLTLLQVKLTTNIVKDAIENHSQFSHKKESHYFIAQFNMMRLNIAPIVMSQPRGECVYVSSRIQKVFADPSRSPQNKEFSQLPIDTSTC